MNETRRRGRLEVIVEMLQAANPHGCPKTRIMYRCNLTHGALEKNLKDLLELGLLVKDGRTYTTTPKGRQFVREYKTLIGRLEPVLLQEFLPYTNLSA